MTGSAKRSDTKFKALAKLIRTAVIFLVILSLIVGVFGIRLDFAGGSHRILPTSVDTDLWGTYKVYYRTTEFTKDVEESVYYIEKSNDLLAEQMRDCVKAGEFIMVYYEPYVGFKGFAAPPSAPITRIEILE